MSQSNGRDLTFFLGTHCPSWLHSNTFPLFVSDRRLRVYKRLPVAAGPWALDSGGFTELQKFGQWTMSPAEYAGRVRRYRDEVGRLRWAAPQDWMCERPIIHGGRFGRVTFAGTRQFIDPYGVMSDDKVVAEHQHRTVANALELREIAPDLPWIYVVQGDTPAQYLRCLRMYRDAGVDLMAEALVGIGTLCRRQGTKEAAEIVGKVRSALPGVPIHTFGAKAAGLLLYGHLLGSGGGADSLAWSDGARYHGDKARKQGLPHGLMPSCSPGPEHPATNCANCRAYANAWRADLLHQLATTPVQPTLWEVAA